MADLKLVDILNTRFNQQEWLKVLNQKPTKFEEAMEIALSDLKPQAWRAAWLLSKVNAFQASRVKRHTNQILKILPFREDGHQRCLLLLLQNVKFTEEQEGKLFNICLNIYENIGKQGSVRITAFSTLLKISTSYPELKNELHHLTEPHYTASFSNGIKRSFQKLVSTHLDSDVP